MKNRSNCCNDISLMLLLPLPSACDNLALQGTLDVVLMMMMMSVSSSQAFLATLQRKVESWLSLLLRTKSHMYYPSQKVLKGVVF